MLKKIILIMMFTISNLSIASSDPIPKNIDSWQLLEKKDEMRQTYKGFYLLLSEGDKFNDKVGITLGINQKFNTLMVNLISTDTKKFNTNCENGCLLSVKFDNEKIEEYPFQFISPNALLHIPEPLNNNKVSNEFVSKILNSKKLIIEIPLENETEQFIFKTGAVGINKKYLDIIQ